MPHDEIQVTPPKRPEEKRVITIDFVDDLPSGVTVTGFAATPSGWGGNPRAIKASDQTDATATIIDAGSSVASPKARINVKGGTDGEGYKVSVLVTLSNNEEIQGDVLMPVRELPPK